PLEVGERFRDLMPDARLVCLARCGHAPMLEHPDAFAEVLDPWLAPPPTPRARSRRSSTTGWTTPESAGPRARPRSEVCGDRRARRPGDRLARGAAPPPARGRGGAAR